MQLCSVWTTVLRMGQAFWTQTLLSWLSSYKNSLITLESCIPWLFSLILRQMIVFGPYSEFAMPKRLSTSSSTPEPFSTNFYLATLRWSIPASSCPRKSSSRHSDIVFKTDFWNESDKKIYFVARLKPLIPAFVILLYKTAIPADVFAHMFYRMNPGSDIGLWPIFCRSLFMTAFHGSTQGKTLRSTEGMLTILLWCLSIHLIVFLLFRFWIRKLHEVFNPPHHALESFSHFEAQVPEELRTRAIAVLVNWCRDTSSHLDFHPSLPFLSILFQTGDIAFTFDKKGASQYMYRSKSVSSCPPRRYWRAGKSSLEELMVAFDVKGPSAIQTGTLFIWCVYSIPQNYFCQVT